MEYLFYYIHQAPNKKWVDAKKAQNIPVIKKIQLGTIILNYLILGVVIIFFLWNNSAILNY